MLGTSNRGFLLLTLCLTMAAPVMGCPKSEEKSTKDDDKKKKGDDDDDDDKPKKKKKADDDDDDKPAKKKGDDDDKPKKKGDDDDKPAASASVAASASTKPSATASGTAAATGDVENFAGVYQSNWGKSTFTQTDTTVSVVYPRGTMSCVAKGKTLYCRWKEGAATGGAVLTKQANGNISGTWGNGPSSNNGGPWNFTKT